jgi:hypothetical protein
MKFSDRPGRYLAIFIVFPILLCSSYNIRKDFFYNSLILFILGILLFFYELYWISFRSDETVIN